MRQLTRRDFLKATAVTGIAAAFSDSLPTGFTQYESAKAATTSTLNIVKTCCRACIGNCAVLAHVKDGRVIKLEGNPEGPKNRGRMCAKGLSGIQALYHPNRNKYPMKRVGARGENKWMRISWDEALDTIARKLMETREKYGAEAVFASQGGGGDPNMHCPARFCNAFDTPNWFEPGAAQCLAPRILAYMMMWGGITTSLADGNDDEIYYPDDTPIPMRSLVLWGAAPSFDSPPLGGRGVAELRARGVRTVVVDPRLTPDAAKADVWLPIRPGSDVALLLAWIRYIFDKKLYDGEFVMKWTNLPYLVNTETKMCLRESDLKTGGDPATYVVWDQKSQLAKPLPYPWDDNLDPALEGTFTVNNIECKTGFQLLKERVDPFTLEKAAEICWLDEHKIEEAIKIYVDTPSGLNLGVATDQNPNSTQAAMAAAALEIIMGNVERPGALLLQKFKKSGILAQGVNGSASLISKEQLDKRLGGAEYKGLLLWPCCHIPTLLDAILTGKPYKPRVWLEIGGNKLASLGNASAWIPAIEQLDFIVQMYMYPTSLSAYADILLPVTEWLETNLPVEQCNKVFAKQAVTHLWETMDGNLIWSKLAKRCADLGHEGCKKAFDPKFMASQGDIPYWDTNEEMLDLFVAPSGMKWVEYVKKQPYEFAPYDEWKQYYGYKKIDPQTGKPVGFGEAPFGTKSKKCEVYAEGLITLGRTGAPLAPHPMAPASKDYDPLPYFIEPFESPMGELGKKFPLVMTNGRLPFFHHTTLRNIPWLREIYPVPELWIHPDAASTYGVSQGDWVWVESQRGKIQARAYVTKGINPGVVYMERFWNPETLDTNTHGWREMNVNILSKSDGPFNDIMGTYTLRSYLVRVSKADGPPKGVWLKPEDFKPWLPEPSAPAKTMEV